jgi:thiosulfate dehydrogenase (quinone) large subunit
MTDSMLAPSRSSTIRLTALVTLRVLIGWHFLFEGFAKMLNSQWTAASFLLESKWIFAGIFHEMAYHPVILKFVDYSNIWGLTLIGLGLIVGCCTRLATVGAMMLLALYYVCNPPLIGYTYSLPSEGSYLIVNKNLIELVALWVLFLYPTGHIIGIDRLLSRVVTKVRGQKSEKA